LGLLADSPILKAGVPMNGFLGRPDEKTIRVLVVDNSPIHTRLLAEALTRDAVLQVIPFESPADVVSVAMSQNVDVLVISSNIDEQPSRGIQILRELRALRPDIRAIVLPDSSKEDVVLQAFSAGARGVFARNEPIELLSKCVRCVYEGQIWANSQHLGIAMSALASSPTLRAVNAAGMNLLSEREMQVVHYLAEGLTNREIAERMKLSQHTVKNYLFRVFDKLGVSSRVELLFMTLSQASSDPDALHRFRKEQSDRNGYSRDEADLLRKSAEAGLPAAQLALAQLYLTQRTDPQDLVEAYMWYLVATERALQARQFVTKMMTPQQINEAQDKASAWLSRRKTSPADAGFLPQPKRSLTGAKNLPAAERLIGNQ
jgi:DNA-binding NarL/FixJ family response regulator